MNRWLLALSLLLSGCSLLVPFFGAERCTPTDPIECNPERTEATLCIDGLRVTQRCAVDELCLLYEESKDSPDTPLEDYDGCGIPIGCGNGDREGAEQCDDGDQINANGCSNVCLLPFCGDGIVQFTGINGDPSENCEPPGIGTCNQNCRFDCAIQEDCVNAIDPLELPCFSQIECTEGECQTQPFIPDTNDCTQQLCIAQEGIQEIELTGNPCLDNTGVCFLGDCRLNTCGNDSIDPEEECDDGNNIPNDGCNPNCLFEFCGNGSREGDEQCDDGNLINFDSCPNDCEAPLCGDGILQQAELCDPSDTTGPVDSMRGQSCTSFGFDGGVLACASGCDAFDALGCFFIPVGCGNGIIESGELCDDGNSNAGDGCSAGCFNEFCGDGFVNNNTEQCDDNNTNSNDGCNSICQLEVCGDAVTQTFLGEQCDDGNSINDDACDNSCQAGGSSCDALQTPPTIPSTFSNNTSNGLSTLDSSCITPSNNEQIYPLSLGQPLSPTNRLSIKLSSNSEADLGFSVRTICEDIASEVTCANVVGSASTEAVILTSLPNNATNVFLIVETEGATPGPYTLELKSLTGICGNNVTEPGEECDDGNQNNFDNCTNVCQSATCGDGFVQPTNNFEECDDGNTVDDDACTNACQINNGTCGNSTLNGVELCDHGAVHASCLIDCVQIAPDSCAASNQILTGGALFNRSTINIASKVWTAPSGCGSFGAGKPENVYQVDIGAPLDPGDTVTIDVNSASGDVGLYATIDCSSFTLSNTSSLGCVNTTNPTAESISFTSNELGAISQFFLIVDTIGDSPVTYNISMIRADIP